MKRFFVSAFLFMKVVLLAHGPIVRAAIDIGMGGPKLLIAEIDVEANKIVNTVHSQKCFVNFYVGKDRRLSSEVMEQGLAAFKTMLDAARSFHADGIVAIATASLRSASNGLEFAQIIQDETGIQVHIIDQELEGQLAFQAVLAKMDVAPEDLVVWDIGGGSIQFIAQSADGSFLVDCGNEGVGAFNEHIISKIQCRNMGERKTANPLSASEISQAEMHARDLSQGVHAFFKEKCASTETTVVGAGSVFGYGVASLVGKHAFSLDEMTEGISRLPDKTDADFDGSFAFCEGVLLAYGYMQGLGIKHMHIVHVNNADGALVHLPFWEKL
jgi:exopolyphosphatase / guanosine-5'-triphosphate,3'-diphosphate pyrophosphatase